jgi:1-acyl-sn-glycerol-3-phosphate acyltransferase
VAKNFAKREPKEYNFLRLIFQRFVVKFIFFPFYKIFYRFEVHGIENLPKDRSFIVAANHLSNLDPPMLTVALRRPVAFMAKKELFDVPIIGTIIDWLGAFSVNREKLEIATIKTAKGVMTTKKWIMALFPQGGRAVPGKITKLTQGFVYLAKASNVEIIPVSIMGSDKTTFIPFTGKIIITIGKPIPVPVNLDETMDIWATRIAELTGFEYKREDCKGFSDNKR